MKRRTLLTELSGGANLTSVYDNLAFSQVNGTQNALHSNFGRYGWCENANMLIRPLHSRRSKAAHRSSPSHSRRIRVCRVVGGWCVERSAPDPGRKSWNALVPPIVKSTCPPLPTPHLPLLLLHSLSLPSAVEEEGRKVSASVQLQPSQDAHRPPLPALIEQQQQPVGTAARPPERAQRARAAKGWVSVENLVDSGRFWVQVSVGSHTVLYIYTPY